MQKQVVESYMENYAICFPKKNQLQIKESLFVMDESTYAQMIACDINNPEIILLFSIFTGFLGVDRFIVGNKVVGFIKLLTFGLFGVLWIIDCFLIQNKVKNKNYLTVSKYI